MQHNVEKVLIILVAVNDFATASGIEPELSPKSDKKFFKTDYPDDIAPAVHNHFGHPYPSVQDDDRYDNDYVKDENDDGGYWKAQMEYDRLKNKLAEEKEQAQKALAKETEEEKELEAAKAAEAQAEKDANSAAAKENEAANDRANADKAHERVKNSMDEATEEVEKEVTDLADCKKQLAEAKAKLKEMLAEKEAAEAKKLAKDEAEKAAEEDEKTAEKSVEELKAAMDKEYGEYQAALKDVEKEKKDVDQAEKGLAESANKLRKYRRADPDGGVYEVGQNGTGKKQTIFAFIIALCAAYLS